MRIDREAGLAAAVGAVVAAAGAIEQSVAAVLEARCAANCLILVLCKYLHPAVRGRCALELPAMVTSTEELNG